MPHVLPFSFELTYYMPIAYVLFLAGCGLLFRVAECWFSPMLSLLSTTAHQGARFTSLSSLATIYFKDKVFKSNGLTPPNCLL
jgi:hypothetical protein